MRTPATRNDLMELSYRSAAALHLPHLINKGGRIMTCSLWTSLPRICHQAMVVGLFAALIALSLSEPSFAEEKFRMLKEKQIRAVVIGRTITDEAHWSDYFRKDGSVVSMNMGRKSIGKWKIQNNELCIYKKELDGCYQVWVFKDEVSLRLEGIDTPFEAYLRDYEGD